MTTSNTTNKNNSQSDTMTTTTTTTMTMNTNNGTNTFKKSESQISNNRIKSAYGDDSGKQSIKGFFSRAVPTMPRPLAVICLILNIFIPGSGNLTSFNLNISHLSLDLSLYQ